MKRHTNPWYRMVCWNCLGYIPAGVQYTIEGPFEGSTRHVKLYKRYCPACWPTGTPESKARQTRWHLRQWDEEIGSSVDREREAERAQL